MLVLESHAALGEALCHALEAAGYHTRHVAEPTPAIVGRLRSSPPALVVVGVEPVALHEGRLALIAAINETGIPTVALSGHLDDPVRRRVLRRAGTAWIVGRSESLERFIEVVGLAATGALPEDDPDDEPAPDRGRAADEYVERLMRLSPRERIVLEQLSLGRTVDEIARHDHVAPSTVRAQTGSVLRKLEVSSQLAAVALLRWVSDTIRRDAAS